MINYPQWFRWVLGIGLTTIGIARLATGSTFDGLVALVAGVLFTLQTWARDT